MEYLHAMRKMPAGCRELESEEERKAFQKAGGYHPDLHYWWNRVRWVPHNRGDVYMGLYCTTRPSGWWKNDTNKAKERNMNENSNRNETFILLHRETIALLTSMYQQGLLDSTKTIQTIKCVRGALSCGLVEAKNLVTAARDVFRRQEPAKIAEILRARGDEILARRVEALQ